MSGPFEPNPRRHQLRGMTAGIIPASPDNESKLEAKIVSEIRAQIPDPVAQDKAIALALERIQHMSPAEIAHIVASLTQAELAASADNRNNSEGVAHYRDDGAYVDEHGNVEAGMSRTSEFMPSTNNIFYGQNGKLKSYDEGWNAWANRYGKGELGNTGFSSHDVYTGVYYGKKFYPGKPALQKLFAITEIAAEQPGTEITTQDGKKIHITPEQIKGYIDRHHIDSGEAQKIMNDPERTVDFMTNVHRETAAATPGAIPNSIDNKASSEAMSMKALKAEQLDFNNLPTFHAPKHDAKQSAGQTPAKAPSPSP